MTDQPAPTQARLAGRLAAGAGIAGALTVPFLGLLLLVKGRNETLESLDIGVADDLNDWALGHPNVVDALKVIQEVFAPNSFRVLVLLVAIALWRARARQLALWAVVTMAAGGLLGVVLKALVQRARPSFPEPVAFAGSTSFPSGHALNSFLGVGVLLVIVLPVLGRTGKTVAWVLGGGVVVLTGFDRVALGVHYVSDVLAGWTVAGAMLAGTATAFGTWRGYRRAVETGLDPRGSRRLARSVTPPGH